MTSQHVNLFWDVWYISAGLLAYFRNEYFCSLLSHISEWQRVFLISLREKEDASFSEFMASLRHYVLLSCCIGIKIVLYSGQMIYPIWKQYQIDEILVTYKKYTYLQCPMHLSGQRLPIVQYWKRPVIAEIECRNSVFLEKQRAMLFQLYTTTHVSTRVERKSSRKEQTVFFVRTQDDFLYIPNSGNYKVIIIGSKSWDDDRKRSD